MKYKTPCVRVPLERGCAESVSERYGTNSVLYWFKYGTILYFTQWVATLVQGYPALKTNQKTQFNHYQTYLWTRYDLCSHHAMQEYRQLVTFFLPVWMVLLVSAAQKNKIKNGQTLGLNVKRQQWARQSHSGSPTTILSRKDKKGAQVGFKAISREHIASWAIDYCYL